MSKLEEFVRLFTKERIDELEFAYYINVFRYKNDEGKWEYGQHVAEMDAETGLRANNRQQDNRRGEQEHLITKRRDAKRFAEGRNNSHRKEQ